MTPRLQAYFSTPLTGVDAQDEQAIEAAVDVARGVCREPALGIDVYYPGDHSHPERDAAMPAEEVFLLDRDRVKDADVLLAMLHVPSVGLGQELNMALASLIPIVLVAPEGARVSRMALGAPAEMAVLRIRRPTDLAQPLREALTALRPRLVERREAMAALGRNVTGARVRLHRERRGWSREELSRASGMTARAIALLEDSPDRRSDPSLTQLRRLAAALGIPAADLV